MKDIQPFKFVFAALVKGFEITQLTAPQGTSGRCISEGHERKVMIVYIKRPPTRRSTT